MNLYLPMAIVIQEKCKFLKAKFPVQSLHYIYK